MLFELRPGRRLYSLSFSMQTPPWLRGSPAESRSCSFSTTLRPATTAGSHGASGACAPDLEPRNASLHARCSTSQACIEAYAAFGDAAMAHYVALRTPVIFECQNEPQGPPFWPNANGTVLAMMCYGVRARAAAAGHLQCASLSATALAWVEFSHSTSASSLQTSSAPRLRGLTTSSEAECGVQRVLEPHACFM